MNDETENYLEGIRQWIIEALDDAKAENILELDIRPFTQIADWMVVASGTSTRHVMALAEKVRESGVKHSLKPIGVEGESEGEWVLLDFGDVIVHLMVPEEVTRRIIRRLDGIALKAPESDPLTAVYV